MARTLRAQIRALARAGALSCRNAGRSPERAARGAPRRASSRAPNTRRWSSCAERWTGTAFVAYRDDREREAQPIAFDGDAWRDFVPVRLPWTLTVKDRAPRGVAAVLINPAHIYPDLALFIDAAEERVADGDRRRARPSSEILQSAADAATREGRQFFKRLWEHDLIVFDAKRPA